NVQLVDRLVDGGVTRIPEHRLPAIVELENPRVWLAHDRNRVETRAERLGEALLRRAQRFLDPPPYVDLLTERQVRARELHRPFRDVRFELRTKDAQVPFALAKRLLRALVIVDVRRRAVPVNDRAGLV